MASRIREGRDEDGAALQLMKVWVLMTGAYDAYGLEGVFTTAEAGMAHWSPKNPDRTPKKYRHPTQRQPPTYAWQKEKNGEWWFDGSQTDCASLTEVEVR
jgi:hypothetical protein